MWAALDIEPHLLNSRPTSQSYPSAFTPNCRPHWDWVISNLDNTADAQTLWKRAITAFLARCRAANTSPFLGMQQSRNDHIVTALRASRRAVLKVLDNSDVFRTITLKAVKRKCKVSGSGFVLRVEGEILAADPTVTRWLLKKPWPAFGLKTRGVYRKTLDHNTEMVFFNAGANMPLRWHIGYEIKLDILPALPNPLASDADMEAFILRVLWPHVMSDMRTREWHRRSL